MAIGAAAAPHVYAGRLAAAIAAFFLAVGVGAHALDELHGRPLGTRLSRRTLIALAVGGLGGALAIGIAGIVVVSPTLVAAGPVRRLHRPRLQPRAFGGRFHTDFWLAASWGGFSALTGWWVELARPALGPRKRSRPPPPCSPASSSPPSSGGSRPRSGSCAAAPWRSSGEQRLADGTVRRLDRAGLDRAARRRPARPLGRGAAAGGRRGRAAGLGVVYDVVHPCRLAGRSPSNEKSDEMEPDRPHEAGHRIESRLLRSRSVFPCLWTGNTLLGADGPDAATGADRTAPSLIGRPGSACRGGQRCWVLHLGAVAGARRG